MLTSLANLLTLSRIAAIPLVVALLFLPADMQVWARWAALGLYTAACITDYVDGYIARHMAQESAIGRFLDPIADKLLVSALLFSLVAVGHLQGVLQVLPALVILLREVAVSGLREFLAGLNVGVPVTRLAKWKTGVQMVALGFLIVSEPTPLWMPATDTMVGVVGLWIAATFTLVTGWDYFRVGMRHMLAEPALEGRPQAAPSKRAPVAAGNPASAARPS